MAANQTTFVLKPQGSGAVATDLHPSADSLPPNDRQGLQAKAASHLGLQRTTSNYLQQCRGGRSTEDRFVFACNKRPTNRGQCK